MGQVIDMTGEIARSVNDKNHSRNHSRIIHETTPEGVNDE
jgi:hypothetical protein